MEETHSNLPALCCHCEATMQMMLKSVNNALMNFENNSKLNPSDLRLLHKHQEEIKQQMHCNAYSSLKISNNKSFLIC